MATATTTRAEQRAEARQAYIAYEMEHMHISGDERGAFAVVQSQTEDIVYKVYFVEPKDGPSYAVSCECPDHFFRHRPCYHMTDIVDVYHQHIHDTIRRRSAPVVVIGNTEMDALVAQLEQEFGLVETASVVTKPEKLRRSAPRTDLIAQLQVKTKVGIAQVRRAFLPECAPRMSPMCHQNDSKMAVIAA